MATVPPVQTMLYRATTILSTCWCRSQGWKVLKRPSLRVRNCLSNVFRRSNAAGRTQYGYNHTSFGPNNTQSNGQFMHTSPSHPSYMVGNDYSYIENIFNTPSQLSHQQQALATPHQPTGMFTRNLIGALSASAFRLHDQNKKFGIWFILQDLSIRTDGIFR